MRRQRRLKLAQRLSAVAYLILFLGGQLREGFISLPKNRIISESSGSDKLMTDSSLAGFFDFDFPTVW